MEMSLSCQKAISVMFSDHNQTKRLQNIFRSAKKEGIRNKKYKLFGLKFRNDIVLK